MQNKKNNPINPLEAKDYYMYEAWEYFKKKENLPETLSLSSFNSKWKDKNLVEKWGAFRHTYTSAAFTQKYGRAMAKVFGDANELIQLGTVRKTQKKSTEYSPGNEPQDRRMDLKNNQAGRDIAQSSSPENLLDTVYEQLGKNKNIILNQYENNDEPYNDFLPGNNLIWYLADKGYENKESINKVLQGIVEYTDPLSLKEKLQRFRDEKIAKYTQRLAEAPEKVAQREAKHVTLEELKAPQEARKQKIRNIIEGKVEFDENADLSGYQNKKSKNNQIFTAEDIEEMTPQEREKNKEAIIYQKQTIGVPTRKQAQRAVEKGGMVHVSAYTRSDGTKVRSYYRSR